MKKRVFGRQLSRGGGARKALLKSLTRALVVNGKIETTKAKAKAVVPQVERLVSLAKNGEWGKISAFFWNDRKITKDFTSLVRQFSGRKAGFTRLTNLPARVGDSAKMVRLEWVEQPVISEQKGKKPQKTSGPKGLRPGGKAESKKTVKKSK